MVSQFLPKHKLKKLSEKGDVGGLAALTHHKDPSVRRDAVEALGATLQEAAFGPLLETVLTDEDTDVANHAARAMETVQKAVGGSTARTLMASSLTNADHGSKRVRLLALFGNFAGPEAVEPLLELLRDPEPGLRLGTVIVLAQLVEALGHLGDLYFIADESSAKSWNERYTREIARALVGMLKDRDPKVRSDAALAVSTNKIRPALDVDLLPQLLAAAGDRGIDARGHATLVALLGAIGAPAVDAALTALEGDADAHVRCAAAEVLGGLADDRAIPALLTALSDPDRGVYKESANALENLADSEQHRVEYRATAAKRWTDAEREEIMDVFERTAVLEEAGPDLWELGEEGDSRVLTFTTAALLCFGAEMLEDLKLLKGP